MNNWIPWSGGSIPVPPETKVRLRLRDMLEHNGYAGQQDWTHNDSADDIVDYMVIGSDSVSGAYVDSIDSACKLMRDQIDNLEQLKKGTLKAISDRFNEEIAELTKELNAKISEARSTIAKGAADMCGLKDIDPKNWKEGDIVKCVAVFCGTVCHLVSEGRDYTFHCLFDGGIVLKKDNRGEMICLDKEDAMFALV